MAADDLVIERARAHATVKLTYFHGLFLFTHYKSNIFNFEFLCLWGVSFRVGDAYTGLILGLRPANERRRYFITTSVIGRLQA